MTDGLPTDEQLRRIERGVQRRIDLRRTVAHRIAGTTAAVALLGGGVALLVPLAGGGSSSGSTAAGAGSAASAAARQQVVCHTSSARDSAGVRRDAPAGADDQALIEACGAAAVEFQSSSGRMPSATAGADQGASGRSAEDAPDPTGSPSLRGPAVLCEATDGVLHVFPADGRPAALCAANGMRSR